MAARDPKMGSAAERTRKNLLTKKVKCGTGNEDGCGGGMTTATGKSGQHRYYACHTSTKAGKSECPGRWTPMDKLDDIVVESVIEKVLAPDRLSKLLEAWLDRSAHGETQDRKELKSLSSRQTRLEGESASVIKLVRNQILSPDDPQVEKELGQIAAQKRAVAADIDALERKLADPAKAITPVILAKFGELIAEYDARSQQPPAAGICRSSHLAGRGGQRGRSYYGEQDRFVPRSQRNTAACGAQN